MAAPRTRVTVSETGESPFAVRIDTGAHELTGDEPVSAGGGGLGPNPIELLTAALTECTAMTVRWYARQQGLPLDHVKVVVDHTRKAAAGTPGSTDMFEKTVFLGGPGLDADQRARLIEVAGRCPIQRILEGTPAIATKLGRSLDEAFDR